MELQTINQALQTVGKAPVLTVSKGPKTGEENNFLAALSSTRITSATEEQIKQVLRYVMIKVGLRANNWPVDEEKTVLLDHIRNHYGNHHLDEIRVAFDMAVSGKLSLDPEQITSYENFSCSYFSSIMNAYRAWAGETYGQLVIEKQPPPDMHPIDTRGLIEEAYQQTGNKTAYKLYLVYFYDQVVSDGLVHPELYKEYLKYAKTEICSEIQQQISPLITGGKEEDQPKIDRLQRQLSEYRAGTRDYEIITRAKQVSVWILLQEARRRKLPALYERVDAPGSLQESY